MEKQRVTSSDLEIINEIYLTVKKIYPEISDRLIHFLAACSLFSFFKENDKNYDVANVLRPFEVLLKETIHHSTNIGTNQNITSACNFTRCSGICSRSL